MLVEFSDEEAKETCLALRYFYDAADRVENCTPEALQIYINVTMKLQDGLKIRETPWERPELYEPEEG